MRSTFALLSIAAASAALAFTPAAGAAATTNCTAHQLTSTVGPIEGAAGSRIASIEIRAKGDATCLLSGHPRDFSFVARDGAALPTTPIQRPGDHTVPVTLKSGDVAKIDVRWSGVPADNEDPNQSAPAELRFTLPNDTAPAGVVWPNSPTFQSGQLEYGAIHS